MTRELDDRRTEEEKKELKYFVSAIDTYMTEWGNDCGRLENATSFAFWFVKDHDKALVMKDWVNSRNEMKCVTIFPACEFDGLVNDLENRKTKGYHASVYTAHDNHRAFN